MKKRKRMKGGSIVSTVHNFVKKHRLVSRLGETIGSLLPGPKNALDTTNARNQVYNLTNTARRFGYGRGMMMNQGVYNAGGGKMRM